MNIKEMIIQNIVDSMPDIDPATPVGDVMKYADDIVLAAETAAEEHLKPVESDESTT